MLSERINATLFNVLTGAGTNGRAIRYYRGSAWISTVALAFGGRTEAETTRNEATLSTFRTFVVSKSSLGGMFPPKPDDRIVWEEAGGRREFAVRAVSGVVFWSYWNNDSRYVKIETMEIRS